MVQSFACGVSVFGKGLNGFMVSTTQEEKSSWRFPDLSEYILAVIAGVPKFRIYFFVFLVPEMMEHKITTVFVFSSAYIAPASKVPMLCKVITFP